MKNHSFAQFIVLLVVVFLPYQASAHPGRTDSSGCHTCRTNCASWGLSSGEYHCHQSKGAPQPLEPIRSHSGEGGTGTTESWPEYQKPKTVAPEPAKPVTVPLKAVEAVKTLPSTTKVEVKTKSQPIERKREVKQEEKERLVIIPSADITLPVSTTSGEVSKSKEGIWIRFWKSISRIF